MTLQARTVGFQPGERNIFFHILTSCNLACKHCYINKEQHGTNMLSLETIKSWLDIFAISRPPDQNAGKENGSNLILLGGEPSLHPDLAGVIAYAKQLGFSVTVDSNGYLFHDLLNRTSPEQLDYLSFSLDGPEPAVNDPIRGEGVFQVCTENLKKGVAKGFNVSLIYTVSSRNIDHLHKMVPLLAKWGVKRFFIQVIGLRGQTASGEATGDNGADRWQVSYDKWMDIVPRVAQDVARAGIHVLYPKVYLEQDEQFECAGLVAQNYFIFPNGRVYRCPLCEDYPINQLNITDNRLVRNRGLLEDKFFHLHIPEGCVMNKLLQPDNIHYDEKGNPLHRISCCLLKQEVVPGSG